MNIDNIKFILLTNIKHLKENVGNETALQAATELQQAVDILDDKGVGLLSKRTAGIIEGMLSIYHTMLDSDCDKKTLKTAFKKAFCDKGLTSSQMKQYFELKQQSEMLDLFD